MKFALFTSTENFVDEHDLIERIFEFGADFLYVDKPNLSELQLEHWLLALSSEIRAKSFICGLPSVALEYGLLGFHQKMSWFNENQPSLKNYDVQCSVETSLLNSEYCKFSHILLNIKTNPKMSENIISEFYKDISVFADGDSDNMNLDALQKMGFDGVSIRSGIWEYADSVSAWRRLCKK